MAAPMTRRQWLRLILLLAVVALAAALVVRAA